MTTTWRLIFSGSGNAAWNMALDEALLKSVALGESPSTLRLYDWTPPALSLGFAQPASDVNLEQMQVKGYDLVRRPTGGRAVLHIDELTYSVTARLDDPILAGSLLESYRKIALALLAALERLKIEANSEKSQNPPPASKIINPVCFEIPSHYEITAFGKKLIGSAQARKYGGLLQHGSLPLSGELRRITEVLNYPSEPARLKAGEKLEAHATTMENVLGHNPGWQAVANAMVAGFTKTFDLALEPAQPTVNELNIARELFESKYHSDHWTLRL